MNPLSQEQMPERIWAADPGRNQYYSTNPTPTKWRNGEDRTEYLRKDGDLVTRMRDLLVRSGAWIAPQSPNESEDELHNEIDAILTHFKEGE